MSLCRIKDKQSPGGFRYVRCEPDGHGVVPCWTYLESRAVDLTAEQVAAVRARYDPILARSGLAVEAVAAPAAP